MVKKLSELFKLPPCDGKWHKMEFEVKREFGPVVRKVKIDGEDVEF